MNQTHYAFSKLLQAITIYRILNFPDNNRWDCLELGFKTIEYACCVQPTNG